MKMIKEILDKYHRLSKENEHHRFRSWEHCYSFFQRNKEKLNVKDVFDHSSLHLAFYLASWGMLRGSSFLLQKDYSVHTYFLESIIMNPANQRFFSDMNTEYIRDEQIYGIDELIYNTKRVYLDNIREINGEKTIINVTDTLASKILLGVYGNVPAYDRYFKNALILFGINSQFNERSLRELASFYNENQSDFNEMKKLFSTDGVSYTPMKLIDMYFWQIGFMMDNQDLYIKELEEIAQFAGAYRESRPVLLKEVRIQVNNKAPRSSGLTQEVRDYIISLLDEAKSEGEEFLDLRSGDLHKELGLKDRLPSVCGAMESIPAYQWTKLSDSPSGKSTTKVIRYYLNGKPMNIDEGESKKERMVQNEL
jgi:hypothetical protein